MAADSEIPPGCFSDAAGPERLHSLLCRLTVQQRRRLLVFFYFSASVWWLVFTHRIRLEICFIKGSLLDIGLTNCPWTSIHSSRGHDSFVQSARKRARHIKSGAAQDFGTWLEAPEVSKTAIQAIGSNGIAFYFSKLRQQQVGDLRNKIQELALTIGFRRFLYPDVDAERGQAVTALILLKPLPDPAEQELLIMSTNGSAKIANAARCVLIREQTAKLRRSRVIWMERLVHHLERQSFVALTQPRPGIAKMRGRQCAWLKLRGEWDQRGALLTS